MDVSLLSPPLSKSINVSLGEDFFLSLRSRNGFPTWFMNPVLP